jgi:hypothetical protein
MNSVLSEIEELRAAFTEEILKRRKTEEVLDDTKDLLASVIYRNMSGRVCVPDADIVRKYKFKVRRSVDDQLTIIEVGLDE